MLTCYSPSRPQELYVRPLAHDVVLITAHVHPAYPPPPQGSPKASSQPRGSLNFPPPPPPAPASPPVNGAFPPPPPNPKSSPPPLQHVQAQKPVNFSTIPMSAPPYQQTFDNPLASPGFAGGPGIPPTYVDEYENSQNAPPREKKSLVSRLPIQEMQRMMVKPMPGAPAVGDFSGAGTVQQDDVGTFNGGSYRISHRDCNTILTLQIAMGCPITAKPGTHPM